jgi:poly(A) polymerase/tRNA nucleotidyltransferase (CCA-adding enzyme)
MFDYKPGWTDAAVRRFIRRAGPGAIDDLLALRAADNLGSGREEGAGNLAELASRVRKELEARVPLGRHQLALDGNDLRAELELKPGPGMGRILDELTERVVAEPALNDRAILLEMARAMVGGPAGAESMNPPDEVG